MPPCCAACPECAPLVPSNAPRRGGFCSHSQPRAGELPVACCADSSAAKCSFWSLSLSVLCLIFGLLCMVFPITLLCYFRTIHQLSLGDAGVGSLERSLTTVCSFTAAHLFSLPFLLCFFDWRFHLMQKDIWLVVLAVRSTSALPIFAGWLSFTLCGYWGLKCDSAKKDDRNFFCMTW